MSTKKLEFLGQCHAPHTVRGYEVSDRKQVWIGDWNYNYSLETDSEEASAHALELHAVNIKGDVCEDDCYSVRKQLGLEFLPVEEIKGNGFVPPKKAVKSRLKAASRKKNRK